MYLLDFFKRLARKSNIPVIIYLLINIAIISAFASVLLEQEGAMAIVYGLVLYILSLAIALSPIGEWILRKQTGCKEIKNPEVLEYLQPIFDEVYERAREKDSSISGDVKLFMNDDEAPNAFATGRKTVCVTRGMMKMPAPLIKATLGHEFGHLAHKDTDLILVVSVGNFIVSGIILFIRAIIDIFHIVMGIMSIMIGGKEGIIAAIASWLNHLLITVCVSGLTWIWTKLGVLLVMKSSRSNEYEADEFSYWLGYGNELCQLLDSIGGSSQVGLFANLASSHPSKTDRITRLQALGATYRIGTGM